LAGTTGRVVQKIDYGRVGDSLIFPELMEVAQTAAEIAATARALAPADLVLPAEAGAAAADAEAETAPLLARLGTARDSLVRARRALFEGTAGTLRQRLESASAFVPGAYP